MKIYYATTPGGRQTAEVPCAVPIWFEFDDHRWLRVQLTADGKRMTINGSGVLLVYPKGANHIEVGLQ